MTRIKYPRTPHLPWSAGATSDDKTLSSTDHFEGKQVVISEKCDGENFSLYRDYMHARSTTYSPHPSRDWIKKFHAQIRHEIPEGWRICGENLFAKHSIHYRNLHSYFYAFSIWTDQNVALDWDETIEYCELLGIRTVPLIYRGIFREDKTRRILSKTVPFEAIEGYVIRLASSFTFEDFSTSVAKYVRANHVQTDEHWMCKQVIPNMLVGDKKSGASQIQDAL
jgi:hypothetical protein